MNHLTLCELIRHVHQFGPRTPVEAELLRRLEELIAEIHDYENTRGDLKELTPC